MSNVHVLLLYGGQSSEHDVSIASARNVFAALDNTKYDISTCLIDREGRWWLTDTVGELHTGSPQLLPVLGQQKFVTLPDHKIVQPDVILPILHGKNGEDGTVQGLAELLGIPCVGPSLLSAAVTMDKDMTKRLLEYAGVPVVPWKTWLVQDRQPTYETIVAELGADVFVKPASAGSSIGVSHVTSGESWEEVLNVAAENSQVVLIEKTIKGRELEVAVLGNHTPRATVPGEVIAGGDFYTYDDKYAVDSASQVVVPADIPETVTQQIKDYALSAYKVTESRGMARVDFFLTDDGSIYLNEVNSIPGFTNISMYPKLWRHEGVTYPALISQLIDLALE
ncbi:TPA: D-alanine--D-alanine ligase A [Candidatus Saccharibacteria bacterium]|nr:D-alanine--D-alanine ligase A [Candidatus Saccharibacteria bacterium]HRK40650.1 D-alanine--D-alanine ligase family protein [Candidatus Saccharibacteria bacterium]